MASSYLMPICEAMPNALKSMTLNVPSRETFNDSVFSSFTANGCHFASAHIRIMFSQKKDQIQRAE